MYEALLPRLCQLLPRPFFCIFSDIIVLCIFRYLYVISTRRFLRWWKIKGATLGNRNFFLLRGVKKRGWRGGGQEPYKTLLGFFYERKNKISNAGGWRRIRKLATTLKTQKKYKRKNALDKSWHDLDKSASYMPQIEKRFQIRRFGISNTKNPRVPICRFSKFADFLPKNLLVK